MTVVSPALDELPQSSHRCIAFGQLPTLSVVAGNIATATATIPKPTAFNPPH